MRRRQRQRHRGSLGAAKAAALSCSLASATPTLAMIRIPTKGEMEGENEEGGSQRQSPLQTDPGSTGAAGPARQCTMGSMTLTSRRSAVT